MFPHFQQSISSFIVVLHEGRLPFFQRFPIKQRFGQAVAEGLVRYLSAEGRVRYLFAEGRVRYLFAEGSDAH
jgi:hypothetical protein